MNGSAKVDDPSGRLGLAASRLRRAIAMACATAVNDLDGDWHLLETSDNTRMVRPSRRWSALLDRIEASVASLTSTPEATGSDPLEFKELDLRVDRMCRRALLSAAGFLTVEAQHAYEIDTAGVDTGKSEGTTTAERVAAEILGHVENRTWLQFLERHGVGDADGDTVSESNDAQAPLTLQVRASQDRPRAWAEMSGWIDRLLVNPVGGLFSSNRIEARISASDGACRFSALTAICESYHQMLASTQSTEEGVQHLKVASSLEGLDILIFASCLGGNPWPDYASPFSPRKEPQSLSQLSRLLMESPQYGADQTFRWSGHGDFERDHHLVRTQSENRFEEIVARHHDTVFRFALFRLGDREAAEDLTQETFIRAFKRFNSVDLEDRDLGHWLISITRSLTVEHVRSGRYRFEKAASHLELMDSVADPLSGPEHQVLAGEANAELLRAVARLKDDQQECITLRYLQGLSLLETAELLGRSERDVRALQHRAVRRLAQLLPQATGSTSRQGPRVTPFIDDQTIWHEREPANAAVKNQLSRGAMMLGDRPLSVVSVDLSGPTGKRSTLRADVLDLPALSLRFPA